MLIYFREEKVATLELTTTIHSYGVATSGSAQTLSESLLYVLLEGRPDVFVWGVVLSFFEFI